MKPIRILNVCAEFAPLAKSGGLADVTSSLTADLAARGHEVRTLLPRYSIIDAEVSNEPAVLGPVDADIGGETVHYSVRRHADSAAQGELFLLECVALYEGEIYGSGEQEFYRFALLCRVAVELCEALDWTPDIIHCHDWHTALLATMVAASRRAGSRFAGTRTILTIHNIGYQGIFPTHVLSAAGLQALEPMLGLDDATDAQINLLETGIRFADALTTVSPTHAREICTSEYGMGLETLLLQRSARLQGILNGVDDEYWNPATDGWIERNYSRDEPGDKQANKLALLDELGLTSGARTPLMGMISRLVSQKGTDLLASALPDLLRQQRLGCAIVGTGESTYVAALHHLAEEFSGQLVFVEAYDERLAHRILAGCDLLVVPSRYEPCGLTQLYALRYGTVPVVRKTGGLADTIRHFDPHTGLGNGSVFEHPDPRGLHWAITTALDWYADSTVWRQLVANGMSEDHSWRRQGGKYEALYRELIEERRTH